MYNGDYKNCRRYYFRFHSGRYTYELLTASSGFSDNYMDYYTYLRNQDSTKMYTFMANKKKGNGVDV